MSIPHPQLGLSDDRIEEGGVGQGELSYEEQCRRYEEAKEARDSVFLKLCFQGFKCSICMDGFLDPSMLQCGHVFCHSCIQQSFDVGEVPHCPLCKVKSSKRNLIEMERIRDIVKLGEQIAEAQGFSDGIMDSQIEVTEGLKQAPALPLPNQGRHAVRTPPTPEAKLSDNMARSSAEQLEQQQRLVGGAAGGTSVFGANLPNEIDEFLAPLPPAPVQQSTMAKIQAMTQGMMLTKTQHGGLGVNGRSSTQLLSGAGTPNFGPTPARLTGLAAGGGVSVSSRGKRNRTTAGAKSCGFSLRDDEEQDLFAPNHQQLNSRSSGSLTGLLADGGVDVDEEEDIGQPLPSAAQHDEDDAEEEEEEESDETWAPIVPCALCKLDPDNRKEIKTFLRSILRNDPTCDKEALQLMNPSKFADLFGQLVGPYNGGSANVAGAPGLGLGAGLIDAHIAPEDRPQYHVFLKKRGILPWPNLPVYLHFHCLAWSPCVVSLGNGKFENVDEEIARAKLLRCHFCANTGATLNCKKQGCSKAFHVACATLTGPGVCSMSLADYTLYCSAHAPNKSKAALPPKWLDDEEVEK